MMLLQEETVNNLETVVISIVYHLTCKSILSTEISAAVSSIIYIVTYLTLLRIHS
jgi:hypothetical protein